MKPIITPYYLIDESHLERNLRVVDSVRQNANVKVILALKCFSTWGVFPLMQRYLDGTTSSSLYEARLGYETFGKEVHAYSVGFSARDIKRVRNFADKIIFNSVSQLLMYQRDVQGLRIGLRVNPKISYSHYDLADPARRYSRLGVCDVAEIQQVASTLSGLMFHFNCENADLNNFSASLDHIGEHYGNILERMAWVSLGGGLYFTQDGYPVAQFCTRVREFADAFGVQVYLEPGEAVITNCAELVTTVVDVVHNEIDIAIVDASIEAHMLDHLIFRTSPKLNAPGPGTHRFMIAGRSCLAGDVFGEYSLGERLQIGTKIRFADAAGYTMVKKNWFNGLSMPAIVIRRANGTIEQIRAFKYKDFKRNLS